MGPRFLVYPISILVLAALGWWLWPGDYAPGTPSDPMPRAPDRPRTAEVVPGSVFESGPVLPERGTPVPAVDDGRSDRLIAMLDSGRYGDAVALYDELYGRLSEAESLQYRQLILSFADALARRGDHASLVALMERYTHLFFKDLPALRLLAASRHVLKQYPAEIEALLLALNEAHLERDVTEFNERLERAIVAQDLSFIQQGDLDGAVEFQRSLASMRPDSIPFQIGLARALVRAGDADEAVALLEALPGNTEYTGQIDRLVQMAEAGRSGLTTAIPLTRSGRSFVVEARVNDGETVRLLVDTGATLTIIRPGALRRAGVGAGEFIAQTTLDTAGGRISASIYRIDLLGLGTESVAGVRVGAVEIPGLGNIDGLLGMNVLNKFRFAIDQSEQVMMLTR